MTTEADSVKAKQEIEDMVARTMRSMVDMVVEDKRRRGGGDRPARRLRGNRPTPSPGSRQH